MASLLHDAQSGSMDIVQNKQTVRGNDPQSFLALRCVCPTVVQGSPVLEPPHYHRLFLGDWIPSHGATHRQDRLRSEFGSRNYAAGKEVDVEAVATISIHVGLGHVPRYIDGRV